jgi:riboflavin kinase/FMN adenylyltransferase
MKIYDNIPDLHQSVFTIGSFDGLHIGHRHLIHQTLDIGKSLGVETLVLTFEPHPRLVLQSNKDFQIINTTNEKLKLLEDIGVENVVLIPFDANLSNLSADEFVLELLKKLKPKVVVLGYDHKFGKDRKGSIETFENHQSSSFDFKITQVDELELGNKKISSTEIRQNLRAGNIREANELLGYHYHISGTVIRGKQLGRTIGFPTANIQIDHPRKIYIPNGVYKTEIIVKEKKYLAATSIGTNPTISHESQIHIETYIIDFDLDIYGENVQLFFLEKVRDEKKFESLEALKLQISKDVMLISAN